MKRLCFLCAAILAAAAGAWAEDFPLAFKTIPAKDVMDFPGGYGAIISLQATKPSSELKREPRAVSRRPLYGELWAGTKGEKFLVRLDESKGDGKGHDQLLVDLNQNGDLTDDAPIARVVLAGERRSSAAQERMLFGPIEAPAARAVAGGRPVYFAEAYVFNRTILTAFLDGNSRTVLAGQLRLKAAWYLETTAEVEGQKRRLGVYDGDSNLRLGDVAQPRITRRDGQDASWYFPVGDVWLVDANGSGSFESDVFQSESCPFGPLLYWNARPCKAALALDCKSLKLERWTEPLAEVAVQPHGEQVRSVTLAWERPQGEWQLLRLQSAGGKLQVPPGNYRLYACDLLARGGADGQVVASASQRVPEKPVNFAPGKDNTLRCGAPLKLEVTARKGNTVERTPFDFLSREPESRTAKTVRINATVVGAGGELYSSYAQGEKLDGRPPKPAFTITDSGGKEVAHGNLEYG